MPPARVALRLLAAAALAIWPSAHVAQAQGVAPIVRPVGTPAGNDWPVYGGNYFNQRYSSLNQINTSNVSQLKGVCTFHVGTEGDLLRNASMESSPIVVNGTMFVSGQLDQVVAVDAATCSQRWRYAPELIEINLLPLCCGFINRGVAVGDGKVFEAQLDAKLVALDQRSGQVLWKVPATGNPADSPRTGYSETMAPQFYQPPSGPGLVIVGASGGEFEARGRVTAFNSANGNVVWQYFTTNQPVPRTDGAAGNDAQSGGPVWQTMPIDPVLGLMFLNVGNPGPDADGSVRPGVNATSDSVVALDLTTGKPKAGWGINAVDPTKPGEGYFQEVHHDIWDYDAASPVILFDLPGPGGPVKGLGQAGKTGWVYLLDRTTGLTLPQAPAPETPVPQEPTQLTNPTQPLPNPAAAFVPNNPTNISRCTPPVVYRGVLLSPVPIFTPFNESPQLICPGAAGGSEWSPHSFSQQTNLMYVCGINQPHVYTRHPEQLTQPVLREGSAFIPPPTAKKYGTLTALDVTTNTIRWQRSGDVDTVFQQPCVGGSLATAGGLVFIGEGNGKLDAFDATTGNTLLQFQADAGVNAPPITYSVNGRQYVAVSVGGNTIQDFPRGDKIWVFALNGTIGPTPAPAPPPRSVANEVQVDIEAFQFQPFEIHVRPGTRVTWENGDDTAHTATADRDPANPANPYEFSSPLLQDGDSFSHTFTRAGEFPYHCNPHPTMLGKVVVSANAPAEGRIVQLRAVTNEADPNDASDLHAALVSTLELPLGRDTVRVPRATIDPSGDATVQFALRNQGGNPQQVTSAALDDLADVLRIVHASSDAERVSNLTVLGTYPVERMTGAAPETVVLRAVLSADRANQIDWSTLKARDLPEALDTLWLHPALAANPDEEAAAPIGPASDDLASAVDAMLGHVNIALEGISSGDVRVARSQFRQFSSRWDDAQDELGAAYPARLPAIQAEVSRAQAGLAEDSDGLRQALLNLRAILNELGQDLDVQRQE